MDLRDFVTEINRRICYKYLNRIHKKPERQL